MRRELVEEVVDDVGREDPDPVLVGVPAGVAVDFHVERQDGGVLRRALQTKQKSRGTHAFINTFLHKAKSTGLGETSHKDMHKIPITPPPPPKETKHYTMTPRSHPSTGKQERVDLKQAHTKSAAAGAKATTTAKN